MKPSQPACIRSTSVAQQWQITDWGRWRGVWAGPHLPIGLFFRPEGTPIPHFRLHWACDGLESASLEGASLQAQRAGVQSRLKWRNLLVFDHSLRDCHSERCGTAHCRKARCGTERCGTTRYRATATGDSKDTSPGSPEKQFDPRNPSRGSNSLHLSGTAVRHSAGRRAQGSGLRAHRALPDADALLGVKPERVPGLGGVGLVERGQVAQDLVAAEFVGRVRIDGEQANSLFGAGLLLPGLSP